MGSRKCDIDMKFWAFVSVSKNVLSHCLVACSRYFYGNELIDFSGIALQLELEYIQHEQA